MIASPIIEADDWLIEQPLAAHRHVGHHPVGYPKVHLHLVPAKWVHPFGVPVGVLYLTPMPRIAVVVQDHLSIKLVQRHDDNKVTGGCNEGSGPETADGWVTAPPPGEGPAAKGG